MWGPVRHRVTAVSSNSRDFWEKVSDLCFRFTFKFQRQSQTLSVYFCSADNTTQVQRINTKNRKERWCWLNILCLAVTKHWGPLLPQSSGSLDERKEDRWLSSYVKSVNVPYNSTWLLMLQNRIWVNIHKPQQQNVSLNLAWGVFLWQKSILSQRPKEQRFTFNNNQNRKLNDS